MNDVVSRHRLSPFNESVQQPVDEMVVHHPLIPLSELDKLSLPNDAVIHAAMS